MTRWGMVIDLDRCTGCGGCIAACHQENNLTAVGAEESALDRGFHWLRLVREVSGSGREVRVRFLPQPCFHCDDPPCAKACPVDAIELTPQYDLVSRTREEMIFDKEKLLEVYDRTVAIKPRKNPKITGYAETGNLVQDQPSAEASSGRGAAKGNGE